MAYRMPNTYSEDHDDEDDYSDIDESVAESVGIDEASDYEDDESVEEFSEEEEEEVDRRASKRRGSRGGPPPPRGAPRRQLPKRSKSFDGDTRFASMRVSENGGGGSGERSMRSSSGSGDRPSGSSHSRRPPPRSKTFDYSSQNSSRSLGGPKMRRGSNTKIDKEAIASNRARRLRAMGGGGAGDKVKLLSRSQSFSNRSSKPLVENDDGDDDDGKSEKRGTRKPMRRSKSGLSELPPEEQQYARTAARGVTRSKSLKAERPNLDKASKNVANRLQAMRSTSGSTDSNDRKSSSSSRYRTKDTDGAEADAAGDKPASKPVGLQW